MIPDQRATAVPVTRALLTVITIQVPDTAHLPHRPEHVLRR